MKILIVDDHPTLRRGLAALIDSEPDLAVCAEADTHASALAALREHTPDLAIVDLALGKDDGLDLVKEMQQRYPAIPALVLSMHDESVYAERSLKAGARGYVTKEQLDGGTYMSEKLEARLAAKFVEGRTLETDSPLDALSDRQLQVFCAIGQGKTTREIADALHLSIKTIESHREHIKDKLSVDSTAQLAQHATRCVETGRSR
jgi:DNA-binding NarL/FixJ family response regulator